MRKSILMFILGAVTVLTLSFGTIKSEILSVKPASPKYYSVQTNTGSEMANTTEMYIKKGYVIHSTFSSAQSDYVTVVFFKY